MTAHRVLLVDHAAVLGGAELSLLDIAIALGSDATVALFEHGPFEERLKASGVSVQVLDGGATLRAVRKDSRLPSLRSMVGMWTLASRLAALARQNDLLYANSPKSFLVSAIAGLLARRPVIWHVRDIIDTSHFSATNIRIMVSVANRRAARVITNSQATADAFISSGGDAARVVVIHNGIDAPSAPVPRESRAALRAALGIPHDAFVVASFSRLSPWKGQLVLLDALEQLPGVHGLIVGAALFGEVDFENKLRERASRAPLSGRIHMLGMRDDVAALMDASDVIVHTSVAAEPFGRVIVEALLARRPVIASNAGGVREIVQHGSTALLTEPGNADELRQSIETLRGNPKRAHDLAERGHAHVAANFSKDAMTARVQREIDAVLEPRRP